MLNAVAVSGEGRMRIVRLFVGNITRGEILPVEFIFIEATIPHLESGALQFVSLTRNLLHGYGSSALPVFNLQISAALSLVSRPFILGTRNDLSECFIASSTKAHSLALRIMLQPYC